MLTINSANNGDVYFSPTFKLKYGIIFITEDSYQKIQLKLTCLNSFIWSGCQSLKCFVSLMCFLLLRSPCLSAFMKSTHLRTFRIAHQEPGSRYHRYLKKTWYHNVFIFLVPTWYRSTGSFDNTTHEYVELMNTMANQRCSDESMLKQRSFVVQRTLTEFWLANTLIINKVQMYVQCKYKRFTHRTLGLNDFGK